MYSCNCYYSRALYNQTAQLELYNTIGGSGLVVEEGLVSGITIAHIFSMVYLPKFLNI